jgi:hypothetical protein
MLTVSAADAFPPRQNRLQEAETNKLNVIQLTEVQVYRVYHTELALFLKTWTFRYVSNVTNKERFIRKRVPSVSIRNLTIVFTKASYWIVSW